MTATVADLQILINADTKGATRAVNDLDKQVKGSEGSIIKSATKIFGAFAVGSFLKGAISTAADFEQQLDKIGAVGGKEAVDRMKEIKALALDLGASTSFSASEAAAGIEEIIKAGMSVDDVMNGGAEAALNLAAATGTDVPAAAELMSATMNLMGISAEEAADIMVAAANASAMSIEDWGYAMKTVGPLAAGLGMDVNELAGYLGVLSNAGIKGEQAGTALRNMFLNISNPSAEVTAAMDALGVSLFDAQGNMRSMDDVMMDLLPSMKNLYASNKDLALSYIEMIAGKDGVAAFLALMDAGPEGVDKMNKSIENQASASEQAKQMTDNLKGAWDAFMGTIETIIIVVLSALVPALRWITEGLNAIANAMLKADWSWLEDGVKGFGKAVIDFLQPAIDIGKEVFDVLSGFGDAFKIFRTNRGVVGGFFAALATSIQRLTGTNVLKWFEKIAKSVNQMLRGVKRITSAFGDLFDAFKEGGLKGLGKALVGDVGKNMLRGFGDLFGGIYKTVGNFFRGIETGFKPLDAILKNLGSAFILLGNAITKVFKGDFSGALDSIKAMFERLSNIGDVLVTLGKSLMTAFENAVNSVDWNNLGVVVGEKVRAAFEAIDWGQVLNIAEKLAKALLTAMIAVPALLGWLGTVLIPKAIEFIGGFLEGLDVGWEDIKSWLGTLGTLALEAIGNLAAWAIPRGIQLLDGLYRGILQYWPTVVSWLSSLGSLALAAIGALGEWLVTRGIQLLDGLYRGAIEFWNTTIKPWLSNDLVPWILAAIPEVAGVLLQKGRDLLQGIKDGILEVWPEIAMWFATIKDKILGVIPEITPDFLKDKGLAVINSFKEGLEEAWEGVATFISGIADEIAKLVPDLPSFDEIWSGAYDLISGLGSGMEAAWGLVEGTINAVLGAISGAINALNTAINTAKDAWNWLNDNVFNRGDDGEKKEFKVDASPIIQTDQDIEKAKTSIIASLLTIRTDFDTTITKIGDFATAMATGMDTAATNLQTRIDTMGTKLGSWVILMKAMATNGGNGFKDNLNTAMSQSAIGFGVFMDNYATKLGTWVSNMKVFATTGGQGFRDNLNTKLSEALAGVKLILNAIDSTVGSFVSTLGSRGTEIGRSIMFGLINGMNQIAPSVYETARRIAQTAAQIIADALKITSPSKVTMYYGEMMGLGLIRGMENSLSQVGLAANRMAVASMPSPMATSAPVSSRTTNIYLTQHNTIDASNVEEIMNVSTFLNDLETERVNTFGPSF